jgi:hypothetical protein
VPLFDFFLTVISAVNVLVIIRKVTIVSKKFKIIFFAFFLLQVSLPYNLDYYFI